MNLDQTQREQLARVLDYLYAEEEEDCRYAERSIVHDGGTPGHHIFFDVKALSDALGEFNSNTCTCFHSRSGKPVTLWCKEHKGE